LTESEPIVHDADNSERREHLVRIEWLNTRPVEEAIWQPGLFTNQVTVCRLRDSETIEYLAQAFGLTEPSHQATDTEPHGGSEPR
jgi:hypothetical protein